MAESNVQSGARDVNREAKKAASSSPYQAAARVGYVVRGLFYLYMGVEALRISLTRSPLPADQQSGLVAIRGSGLGTILLAVALVPLGAYALWGFVRAFYDPLHRGDDAGGYAARLGFAWSGIAYSGLFVFAAGVLVNKVDTQPHDSTRQLVSGLLTLPAGVILAKVVGILTVIAGIGQFVDAVRAPFNRDLRRREMSAAEKKAGDVLGRSGMVARGVVFTLMGWFIVLAAWTQNGSEARGFGDTFTYILQQPFGRVLLAVVACGFIALGLHSIMLGRFIRMPRGT